MSGGCDRDPLSERPDVPAMTPTRGAFEDACHAYRAALRDENEAAKKLERARVRTEAAIVAMQKAALL